MTRSVPSLRPATWPGWAEALSIGIVSRLFATAVLLTASILRLPEPVGRHWQSPFLIWDSEWYLWVANHGYHAAAVAQTPYGSGYHDFSFFPAWPLLLAALTLGGRLPIAIVAPLAANLLFVLALVPIGRVLERVGGRAYARFGLLLLAFSPAAYVYSLAYGEPLFLLLAGLFFMTSGTARRAGLGALAMLVRLSGAALAAASVGDLFEPSTRRRGIVAILGVAGAFAAWWAWIAVLTGDPMGYMQGSPSWYAADAPHGSLTGLASILAAPHPAVWITIAILILLGIGTVSLLRRGELQLGLFSAACLASTWLVTWNTMPRLAVIAFPACAALAALLPNDRARWALVGLSAAAEAILGALAVAGIIVP